MIVRWKLLQARSTSDRCGTRLKFDRLLAGVLLATSALGTFYGCLARTQHLPTTDPTSIMYAQELTSEPVIPEAVGAYHVIAREEQGQREAGVKVRYRSSSGELDVFVYPLPYPDGHCHHLCRVAMITREANGFIESFPLFRQRGYYTRIEVVRDTTFDVGAGGVSTARHLELIVESEKGAGRSDYIIATYFGFFVKLRSTDVNGVTHAQGIRSFFHAFIAAVGSPYHCRLGWADNQRGLMGETAFTLTPDAVAAAIDSTLVASGYTLRYASNGVWTTKPSFEWPVGMPEDIVNAVGPPGYQVHVQMGVRNDSTVVTVMSPTICKLGPAHEIGNKDVQNILQLLTNAVVSMGVQERLAGTVRPMSDELRTLHTLGGNWRRRHLNEIVITGTRP